MTATKKNTYIWKYLTKYCLVFNNLSTNSKNIIKSKTSSNHKINNKDSLYLDSSLIKQKHIILL